MLADCDSLRFSPFSKLHGFLCKEKEYLLGDNSPNVLSLSGGKKERTPNPKSSASLFLHDGDSTVWPHFSISLALVVFSLPFSFLLFPLATSSPLSHPPHALPGHSSRRVHFERINTVPIKGQRAARRSTRRHHSLSRTLLRYGRKSLACVQS